MHTYNQNSYCAIQVPLTPDMSSPFTALSSPSPFTGFGLHAVITLCSVIHYDHFCAQQRVHAPSPAAPAANTRLRKTKIPQPTNTSDHPRNLPHGKRDDSGYGAGGAADASTTSSAAAGAKTSNNPGGSGATGGAAGSRRPLQDINGRVSF